MLVALKYVEPDIFLHEMTHAWIDENAISVSESENEGMAYTMGAYYTIAKVYFEGVEHNPISDCSERAFSMKQHWQQLWREWGKPEDWATVSYDLFRRPLSASDIDRVTDHLGAHFDCPIIAKIVNYLPENRRCSICVTCNVALTDTDPTEKKWGRCISS
jgi:hypothetical protein